MQTINQYRLEILDMYNELIRIETSYNIDTIEKRMQKAIAEGHGVKLSELICKQGARVARTCGFCGHDDVGTFNSKIN